MLTSKRRAELRALANPLETIVHIGKDGITENLVKQATDALAAREMIKCRVLESAMLTAREACDELSRLTGSEPIQVIGTRFVIYREKEKKEKRPLRVTPTPRGRAAKTVRTGAKTARGPGKPTRTGAKPVRTGNRKTGYKARGEK